MGLNSINTNIAAYYAQQNIGKASSMSSSSIARLSSGDRIVRAADDVAAMSAGTSLQTNVTTLRMALINTSQGSSLLQVADGALSQVTDILQRQKAIAVQAGSGSLTSNERSFLNQEFQALTEEIDRLAEQTNFNGVDLLNGALSEKVDVSSVDDIGGRASGSISFSDNVAAAETIILNGSTFTAVANGVTPAADEFEVGLTVQDTLNNLVTQLNASTDVNISEATYSRDGNSLVIVADNAGSQGNDYTIDAASTALSAAGEAVINGGSGSVTQNIFSAAGLITATSITETVTAGVAAQATPFAVGEALTVDLGGGAQTIHTFAANESLEDIANAINATSDNHGVSAKIIGSSGAYNIQLETNQITTDNSYLVASATDITVGGAAATVALGGYAFEPAASTANNFTFSLAGGSDVGIGAGDTVGRGVTGDDIITDQNQQRSEIAIVFPDISAGDLADAANFGNAAVADITIEGATFSFATSATGPAEAAVGATLTETLDNMVATINSYEGTASENYSLNQIEAYRDGNSIKIRSIDNGTTADISGAAIQVTSTNLPAGSSVTNSGNLSNGTTGGVTTRGVTNADFTGTISGFSATFSGTANQVDMSVTVGENTYTATSMSTNPTADTTVRFSSQDGGGYFDVQMAANKGVSVTSQAEADGVGTSFNAAFSSLTFYQNREVDSYEGNAPILTNGSVTGSLIDTSVELQGVELSGASIDSIRVTAPVGSNENGSITISINGEEYTSASNIGSQLGANTSIELVSATDADKILTFNTGETAIQFDTSEKAASFQNALEKAFGVGDGDAALSFQVGVTTSDTLSVSVDSVTTNKLFEGATLDVLTQESASAAADAIDLAIDSVTSVRATVGALQSRFDFAAANVESSIQNQDAARGVLLDTDISAESTAFATAQVQLQAGISVLAQANQLPQNLLKLIG